ncbi:Phosphoglucosamine mutase [Bienertia sinuspersici]
MAFLTAIRFSPTKLPLQFQFISSQPNQYTNFLNFKRSRVTVATSIDSSSVSVSDKPTIFRKNDYWQWKFSDKSINIYYEEHGKEGSQPSKNMLMVPTISDVSTVDEWSLVVSDMLQQDGNENLRATLVDWPGLGNSDRPKLDYTADVMEKFLVDLINSSSSPVCDSGMGFYGEP